MERKELLFAVNPVFATAKGCLVLLSQTGIKEAADLAKVIDLTVPRSSDTPPEILRSYMVSNEARYHIGNKMAEQSGCDVIIDLPCGYVPRGLSISKACKHFYGLDLPAVVEELEPAIRELAAVTFSALTDSDGEIVKEMMEKGGTKVADIPINHTVI